MNKFQTYQLNSNEKTCLSFGFDFHFMVTRVMKDNEKVTCGLNECNWLYPYDPDWQMFLQ